MRAPVGAVSYLSRDGSYDKYGEDIEGNSKGLLGREGRLGWLWISSTKAIAASILLSFSGARWYRFERVSGLEDGDKGMS